MPTESFLNQKSWHPRSGANLRRLEEAEERARRERKQAEARAAELERERERLDAAASAGAGPRAELQFMYSAPPGFGAAPGPTQEGALRGGSLFAACIPPLAISQLHAHATALGMELPGR